MIKIGSISKFEFEDKVRLASDIQIPEEALKCWMVFSESANKYSDYSYITRDYIAEHNKSWKLYFEVDKCYSNGLVDEVADAFVVSLLYFAMITNENIESQFPVSENLFFNLNQQLLPLLCKASGAQTISIKAPLYDKKLIGQNKVATGMSCGVDSLSAFQRYSSKDIVEDFRVNCLTNFDVGSERYYFPSGLTKKDLRPYEKQYQEVKEERLKKAKSIALKAQCDFIQVDSNISDLYQGCFERSHLYRSAAAALTLQKYFSKYYMASSGCEIHDYNLNLNTDPAHYEQLLVPLLSTNSLQFIVACKDLNRIDKLRELSSFQLAQNNLMVCGKGNTHCYSCSKEFRTLIIIDIIDAFDEFKNVFDEKRARAALWKSYFWLLKERRKQDASSFYIYEQARDLKKIPLKSYIYFFVWKLAYPVRQIRKRRGIRSK